MIDAPPWLEPVKAHLLRIMVAPHRRHRFERLQVSWTEDPWLENYKRRFPGHQPHPDWQPYPTYRVTFSVFSPTRATEKATRMLMTELEPHLDRIVFQHWGSIPRWGATLLRGRGRRRMDRGGCAAKGAIE